MCFKLVEFFAVFVGLHGIVNAAILNPCAVVAGWLSSWDSEGEADWNMTGQKVTSVCRGGKKEKNNGGVVGAAASASSSPTVSQNQYTGPSCTGCGIMIGKDVRAVQCDRCCKQDLWKCIDCLDITGEVYDTLI